MPQVSLDYTTPEAQPPLTQGILTNANTDFSTGVVTGVFTPQDASGAIQSAIRFELTLSAADLTAIATPLIAALQVAINPETGLPYLPPGVIVVTP